MFVYNSSESTALIDMNFNSIFVTVFICSKNIALSVHPLRFIIDAIDMHFNRIAKLEHEDLIANLFILRMGKKMKIKTQKK